MSATTVTEGTTTQVPVAVPRTFIVDPQIQNVAVLLVLGVLGTLLNVALLAGALTRSRFPGSLGCAPQLSAALAQFAFAGLVESTSTMMLAAAYSGGGLTSTAMNPNEISHPAKSTLIACLFFVSTLYAWSMVSIMLASVKGISTGLVMLIIIIGLGVSAAVGATTGYFVGIEKSNISSTVLVPRLKLVAIPQALRWSIVAVAFALPWTLWLMLAILAAVRASKPSDKVFQFGSEAPPSTAAIVSTIVILYMGLRVPYEVLSLITGPRPPTLHSAMTWARFGFAVAAPFMTLGSARRFKAALMAAFMCCRRRRVSPPEAPAQADGERIVPAACPVLFQTPTGLYMRRARYNHHPTAPGFTYSLCDVEVEKIQRSDTWDKMDLFMKSNAFFD